MKSRAVFLIILVSSILLSGCDRLLKKQAATNGDAAAPSGSEVPEVHDVKSRASDPNEEVQKPAEPVAEEEAGVQSAFPGMQGINPNDPPVAAIDLKTGRDANTFWDRRTNSRRLTSKGITEKTGRYVSPNAVLEDLMVADYIRWTPRAPYGKPLPNNGQKERDYLEGNIDMSNSVLVLHNNEADSGIIDDSGQFNDGSCSGACPVLVQGIIDKAVSYRGGQFVNLGTRLAHAGSRTYSFWLKMPEAATNGMYLASDWNYAGNRTQGTFELNIAAVGILSFYQTHEDGSYVRVEGTKKITPNVWHHIAAIRDDSAKRIELYLDGELYARARYDGKTVIGGAYVGNFMIGMGGDWPGRYFLSGDVDEVGIWNTAFNATTIRDLYRRGAMNIKLQFKVDGEQECIGPDGTSSTFFSELNNQEPTPPEIYIEYYYETRNVSACVVLETQSSKLSPDVGRVEMQFVE